MTFDVSILILFEKKLFTIYNLCSNKTISRFNKSIEYNTSHVTPLKNFEKLCIIKITIQWLLNTY